MNAIDAARLYHPYNESDALACANVILVSQDFTDGIASQKTLFSLFHKMKKANLVI
jgi:hypothetical protein